MKDNPNDLFIQKEIVDDAQYAIKEYVDGGSKKKPVLVAKGKWIKDKYKSNDWDEIIAKCDKCEGGVAYEIHVFDKGTTETKGIYRSIAPTMTVNDSGQYEEKQIKEVNQMKAGLNDFMGDFVAQTESRHISEIQGLRNDLSEVRTQLRDFTVENANLKAENERLKTQYDMEQRFTKAKEDMENQFEKELEKLEGKPGLADGLSSLFANPAVQAAVPILIDKLLGKWLGGNNHATALQVPTQQEIENGMMKNAATD